MSRQFDPVMDLDQVNLEHLDGPNLHRVLDQDQDEERTTSYPMTNHGGPVMTTPSR